MHVFDVKHAHPITSPYGETVYEILGLAVGNKAANHSVAHVVIDARRSSRRHYHPQAQESYYIIDGRARIELGDEQAELMPGQIVLISPPLPHKIINLLDRELVFLAICVPAWEPTNTVWLE